MFSISMTNHEDHSVECFKTDDQSKILGSYGLGSMAKGCTKFNLELSAREAAIVHSITGLWLYKHFGEVPDLLEQEDEDKIDQIFGRICGSKA
jgi:hypothetical protein